MMRGRTPIILCLLGASLLALTQTGCVRRRMTIRSNPPGALVYVDNYEIGVTPCSTSFLYYGTREIRLVKDGYETLTVKQPIPTPWYQIPPLDFFSENVAPQELRDEHVFTYTLTPQVIVPTEQLIGRAEELRRGVQLQAPGAAPLVIPTTPGTVPASPGAAGPPGFAPPPLQPGPQTIPRGGQPIESLPAPY